MLKVVGTESTQDEVDGRSLLDEIAREGARGVEEERGELAVV